MTDISKLSCYLLSLVFTLVFFLSPTVSFAQDKEIRIALRAHKGAEKAINKWQATADYLTEKIPGYRFILVPFEINSALNQAVSQGDFHFCLTNPAAAVEHQIRYGAQPMATLMNKRQGKGYTKFGTVIFTRADRHDIKELNDLKGKVFIGADEIGFGGWRVAWAELLKHKINPFTDFKALSFAGGKQQKVVYAIRDGDADVGSVRTDMLERMASTGKIRLNDFKVINDKKTEGFPFLHSTDLYPEWPFSSIGEVDNNLKKQVASALFSIPDDGLAAKNGKYVGWVTPLDYTKVNNLLKDLKVGPYHVATMAPLERLVSQYGLIVVIVITIIILLTLTILYMVNLNRRIRVAQYSLENEVSKRHTLEQQLIQIQKMESLGQLTGGIAHDFNNMLAIILGFAQLASNSDSVKSDSKLTRYIEQIMTTGDKAKTLISQMLAFSRSQGNVGQAEVILVSDIIDEVHQLLRPLLPSSIDLVIDMNNRELYIDVSAVMINQVLMNLCLNSRDAMVEKQGVISISMEAVEVNHIQCNSCYQDIFGSFISIEIKDNGSGIDSISAERLFEPFYSTKAVGKGTGMGLSMVHGIIHQHGGHILVDSIINEGTTIKILLPQAARKVNEPRLSENLDKIESANNGHNHILIVDDEKAITSYLGELLQQHGYKVTELNNSQEALSYYETHHDTIDLVLTDQTMPNLTGTEMATRMLAISDDLPVILCSGYNEQIDEKKALEMNIRAYMQKPIQSNELINTINSLLSQIP